MARSDNSRGRNKISSFITTRCSPHRLHSLVNSLSEQQKSYVRKHGFGGLLSIRKCKLPMNLLEWLLQYVEMDISQVFIRDGKAIPLDARLVHLALGIPLGGRPVVVAGGDDRIAALKSLFVEDRKGLKMSQLIPRVVTEQSEEAFIRSFLMVVLSCFLCPSASLRVNSNFLHALVDVDAIRNLNWSQYVLDYLLADIQRYKSAVATRDIKKEQLSISVGGCLLFLAVVYFDHVDIGDLFVPSDFPRIAVLGTNEFELLENIDQSKNDSNLCFGKRPFRHPTLTPYSADAQLSLPCTLPAALPWAPPATSFDSSPERVSRDFEKSKVPGELNAILEKHIYRLHKTNQDIANEFLGRIKRESAKIASSFMEEVLEHVSRCRTGPGTPATASHSSEAFTEEGMAVTSDDDGQMVVVEEEIAAASDGGQTVEEEGTNCSDGQKATIEEEIAPRRDGSQAAAMEEEMRTAKVGDHGVSAEEEEAGNSDDCRRDVTEEVTVAACADVVPADSFKNNKKRKAPMDTDAEDSSDICDRACKRLDVATDQENFCSASCVKCDTE